MVRAPCAVLQGLWARTHLQCLLGVAIQRWRFSLTAIFVKMGFYSTLLYKLLGVYTHVMVRVVILKFKLQYRAIIYPNIKMKANHPINRKQNNGTHQHSRIKLHDGPRAVYQIWQVVPAPSSPTRYRVLR